LRIDHWDIDVSVVADGPSTAMSPSRPHRRQCTAEARVRPPQVDPAVHGTA